MSQRFLGTAIQKMEDLVRTPAGLDIICGTSVAADS
jgi:hypothetical protein